MKKIALLILFFASILALSFIGSEHVYSQTRAIYCAKLGLPNAVGQCNASCQVYCPAGYQTCNRNNNGTGAFGSCIVPDRACAWQMSDGTRRTTGSACCCPIPTVTPTPRMAPRSCQGQYFGKPQCDWRAPATYSQGGICQLNPNLGIINLNNPNDPINYWKWSYCRSSSPTLVPTPVLTIPPSPTPTSVAYVCGRENCSGCCVSNVCHSGKETLRCGVGGILCTNCSTFGMACSNQVCIVTH